jgi:hypothetical protein
MDPTTGQWLSVDSVPTEPRYLYAHNSPTFRIDPNGKQGVATTSDLFHSLLWFQMLFRTEPVQKAAQSYGQSGMIAGWDTLIASMIDAPEQFWKPFVEWQGGFGNHLLGLSSDLDNSVEQLGRWLPNPLSPIPIPTPGLGQALTPNMIPYVGGVLFGVYHTAAHMFLDLPSDILKLVLAIFKLPTVWKELTNGVTSLWNDLKSGKLIHDLNKAMLSPYYRGKILGILLSSIVALLWGGKGLILAAKNIPQAIQAAIAAMRDLPKIVEEVKATYSLWRATRRSPEEVLEAAVKDAEQAIRDSKFGPVIEDRPDPAIPTPADATPLPRNPSKPGILRGPLEENLKLEQYAKKHRTTVENLRNNLEILDAVERNQLRDAQLQDQLAKALSDAGYDVVRTPRSEYNKAQQGIFDVLMEQVGLRKNANPDYRVNGNIFDAYSPRVDTEMQNIIATIGKKAGDQAFRIGVNLSDSPYSISQLESQMGTISKTYPQLKEVFAFKNGSLKRIYVR